MTKKRKRPNADVFPNKKRKLGKKLQKSTYTPTEIRSKSIQVNTQNLRDGEEVADELTTSRNLSLPDLTKQLKHYNPTIVKEAVLGLIELVNRHPIVLTTQLNKVLREVTPMITYDKDVAVLRRLRTLFGIILPAIPKPAMSPFMPMMMAFVSSGMTHLDFPIRSFSLDMLQMLLTNFGAECAPFASKMLPNMENLLAMINLGVAYKGKKYHEILKKVLICLDLFITVLFEHNKLKIAANDWNERGSAGVIAQDSNATNQFTWKQLSAQYDGTASTIDTITIHSVFQLGEVEKNAVLHKIMQRKIAESQQLVATTEDAAQSTGTKTPVTLHMDNETLAMYSLDNDEAICNFFDKILHNFLKKIWIEFVGTPTTASNNIQEISAMHVHMLQHVLNIMYKLMFAAEHIQLKHKTTSHMNPILNSFYKAILFFTKHLPLESAVQLSATDQYILQSSNVTFLAVMSFVFGYQPSNEDSDSNQSDQEDDGIADLWEPKFVKNLFTLLKAKDLSNEDFSRLLSVLHRVYPQLQDEVITLVWQTLTTLFTKEGLLSDKQQILLQFFAKAALGTDNMTVAPNTKHLRAWTEQLPIMLYKLATEEGATTGLLSKLLQVVASLVKDKRWFDKQMELTWFNSMSKFFYHDDTLGPFITLDQDAQAKVIQLFYHGTQTFSNDFIKSFSKCCTSPNLSIEILIMAMEMIRHQYKLVPTALYCTFLYSILCSRSMEQNVEENEHILHQVMISLRLLKRDTVLNTVRPFFTHVIQKKVNDWVSFALLKIIRETLVWLQGAQPTDKSHPKEVLLELVPQAIIKFYSDALHNTQYILAQECLEFTRRLLECHAPIIAALMSHLLTHWNAVKSGKRVNAQSCSFIEADPLVQQLHNKQQQHTALQAVDTMKRLLQLIQSKAI